MPNKEKMVIDERYKFLRIVQEDYRQAKRKGHSQLLDHMERVTGLNRKTLIRHMNGKIERKRVAGEIRAAALPVSPGRDQRLSGPRASTPFSARTISNNESREQRSDPTYSASRFTASPVRASTCS